MTLLTPIAAALAAGLGVPVLLALYLLKLRRRPVRISSTMLWEQAVKDVQVNVPFRWLRPSWLLLLHLLILALFVLAIGRPVLGEGGEVSSRIVLLVDRSASMSATDAGGGRTRLQAAIARGGELADEFARSASPQFTVVTFAASARVVGRPTTDPAEVKRQLASIEPTDQPGNPAQALALVSSLTGPTDEQEAAPRPLVILLSDGGGLGAAPLDLAGADLRYERTGPPEGAPANNTGIIALSGARDRDDPALVRIYAGLLSTAPDPVGIPLTLRIDGEQAQRRAVRLPARGDAGEPGEAGVTFEFRQPAAALVEVRIDRADALASDNAAALTLPPARLPAVLLVAPGDDAQPTPDPFLADVLGELPLRQLRVVSPSTYERFGADAALFDVIIFDRTEPPAVPPRPSLSFGASIPGLPAAAERTGSVGIAQWDRSHPVLRDLTLDPLIVARRLGLPDAPAAGSPLDTLRVLASADEAPVIVSATSSAGQHLVVAFAVGQSNWPVHFGFPVFIAAAIEHLAPGAGATPGVSYTTAQPVRVRAAPGTTAVTADGPAPASAQAPEPGGLADLGVLPRAGVYRLTGAGPAAAIGVNLLDPAESALDTAPAVTVAGRDAPSREAEAAGPREIWAWFVLAAFALLAIEWALYTLLIRA